MRSILSVPCLLAAFSVTAGAADFIVNEAQRNGPQRIAPGSIVLIGAEGTVGPSAPEVARGFPLRTNLGGTSVRIEIGGVSVDAYVLATESRWVRAMVPSNTPVGRGQFIVSFNGREVSRNTINVAERGLGLFSGAFEPPGYIAPSFRFGRLVQNVSATRGTRPNSAVDTATPGELIVLWATGLGAAPGDEAAGPIPGDLSVPGLEVFVGNQRARVLYAGRSGCCAGLDQIIFEAPPGIIGCNVPVWVRFSEAGHGSNEVLVSVGSRSGACADVLGLADVETEAVAAGQVKAARITAFEDNTAETPRVHWSLRFGDAALGRRIPFGTCVNAWGLNRFAFELPAPADAGPAVNIQSSGSELRARRAEGNTYDVVTSGSLQPGNYTFENLEAGSGVGRFRFFLPVLPNTFRWTNSESLTSASISEGVTVLWTPQDPEDAVGSVTIHGEFASGGEIWGTGLFACHELARKGTFTLPPAFLARMASDWLDRPSYPGANVLRVSIGYEISQRADYIIGGVGLVEFTTGLAPKPTDTKYVRLLP